MLPADLDRLSHAELLHNLLKYHNISISSRSSSSLLSTPETPIGTEGVVLLACLHVALKCRARAWRYRAGPRNPGSRITGRGSAEVSDAGMPRPIEETTH
jgi:hypothetical protein